MTLASFVALPTLFRPCNPGQSCLINKSGMPLLNMYDFIHLSCMLIRVSRSSFILLLITRDKHNPVIPRPHLKAIQGGQLPQQPLRGDKRSEDPATKKATTKQIPDHLLADLQPSPAVIVITTQSEMIEGNKLINLVKPWLASAETGSLFFFFFF